MQVEVRGTEFCKNAGPPAAPDLLRVSPVADKKNSHQWGTLRFVAPAAQALSHYEVRYSTKPIIAGDLVSFMNGRPAVAAKIENEALVIPRNRNPGDGVEVDFGGMLPLTHYWVALRAVDVCNVPGPFAVAEMTTTEVHFTKLSGCFIATAAYGSTLDPAIASLRALRDQLRPRNIVLATGVDLYYRAGPVAASAVEGSDVARAVVRSVLRPLVVLAEPFGR